MTMPLITAPLLLFFIFSAILVAAAVMVVAAKNPVHSVLFLILSFFNAAGLFVLSGAELLAMTLIIVYVGAVAVLFLFVVMMFDVHMGRVSTALKRYKGLGICVGLVLFAEMVLLYLNWHSSPLARDIVHHSTQKITKTNAHALGSILYTDYAYLFQISGLILLVAIVGAITLTLQDRVRSKHQKIGDQINREAKDAVKVVKVRSREGVKL